MHLAECRLSSSRPMAVSRARPVVRCGSPYLGPPPFRLSRLHRRRPQEQNLFFSILEPLIQVRSIMARPAKTLVLLTLLFVASMCVAQQEPVINGPLASGLRDRLEAFPTLGTVLGGRSPPPATTAAGDSPPAAPANCPVDPATTELDFSDVAAACRESRMPLSRV